jgi:hypothetical protein
VTFVLVHIVLFMQNLLGYETHKTLKKKSLKIRVRRNSIRSWRKTLRPYYGDRHLVVLGLVYTVPLFVQLAACG